MAKRSLEDIDEYYGGMLPDVNISASVPSIYTKKGERLAKLMANDVYQGKMNFRDVPKDYQNYVEGEVKGAIPTRQSLNKIAKPIGLTAASIMGGLGVAQLAPSAIAAYTNFATKHPLLMRGIDTIGTIDSGRNILSKNGIGKTIRLAKEGDIKGAIKSGAGDVLDIVGTGDAVRYLRSPLFKDRLAETILRMGDFASSPSAYFKQFGNKKTLAYLGGSNNKNLAYELPIEYSGEFADVDGGHPGDIIDQFLGKSKVPDAIYDKSVLPKEMRDYVENNYPNKNIPIRLLGNKIGTIPNDKNNQIILNWEPIFDDIKKGKSIRLNGSANQIIDPISGVRSLDPGGHQSYVSLGNNDNVIFDNWDIWKFNPNDYLNRYDRVYKNQKLGLKGAIKRRGLTFIDSRGTPIIHNWKDSRLMEDLPTIHKRLENTNEYKKIAEGAQDFIFDKSSLLEKIKNTSYFKRF